MSKEKEEALQGFQWGRGFEEEEGLGRGWVSGRGLRL